MSSTESFLKVGDLIPLSAVLKDDETALTAFPRVVLYKPDGTVNSTIDLAFVSDGRYVDFAQTMPDLEFINGHLIIYTDSGHTSKSTVYVPEEMTFKRDLNALETTVETISSSGLKLVGSIKTLKLIGTLITTKNIGMIKVVKLSNKLEILE